MKELGVRGNSGGKAKRSWEVTQECQLGSLKWGANEMLLVLQGEPHLSTVRSEE